MRTLRAAAGSYVTLTVSSKSLAGSFLLFASLFLAAASQPGYARTIVVTSNADDGNGSLRQALALSTDGDKINVNAKGTITLTTGELMVTKSVTITGPGVPHATVSGNGLSRVFHIFPGKSVTISGLTIANGAARTEPGFYPYSAGGGIYNERARLTLTDCVLSGNVARYGGAIYSITGDAAQTPLTITTSTLTNNRALYGGAIYNAADPGASLSMANSVIHSNSADFGGGGIFNDGGGGANATASITSGEISSNTAVLGGGLYNEGEFGSATMILDSTKISSNTTHFDETHTYNSGGGIFNDGYSGSAKLTLKNALVEDNSAPGGGTGGGITNDGGSGIATLLVDSSTIRGNWAFEGGGVSTRSYLGSAVATFVNCSIVSNHASFFLDPGDDGHGGGIDSSAVAGAVTVTLSNCSVEGNSAGDGGGIYNTAGYGANASVTATSSRINNNSVVHSGGGIYNEAYPSSGNVTLTLTDTSVSGNSANDGGGLFNTVNVLSGSATAVLTNCTLAGNSSDGFLFGGGAVVNFGLPSSTFDATATVTLSNCVVTGNSSSEGAGIANYGNTSTLIVNDTTVSDNKSMAAGGGISNHDGTTMVNNSTISGNTATWGGGLANTGTITLDGFVMVGLTNLTNSTVSGNSANYGGGLYNYGFCSNPKSTLYSSTLSGNSASNGGGGIINFADGCPGDNPTVELSNTILNGGATGENIANLVGSIISHGYNLSSDAAGGDSTTGPGGLLNYVGDIRNTNPLLGPLQNNGGPTKTHALLVRSPAINAGDPSFNPYVFNPPLLYDQRNSQGFPRVINGRIDIGAYEYGAR